MLACFVRFRPGTILILRGRRARGCRTGMALLTAGFAQCVCQDFTNCRLLMAFLCCQALAQDAGAHGQRGSEALKFLVDHFLCCRSCSMFCPCFGRSHCCQAPTGCHTRWKRHCSHDLHWDALRARYVSAWNVIVHAFEYGASNGLTQCVKNHLLPSKNIFASKESAVASAVQCCQVFSVWRWNCDNVV